MLAACSSPAPSREIVVEFAEFAFRPDTLAVALRERLRVTLRNVGDVEHDFAPDDRARALGLRHFHLRPGQNASFDWTAPVQAGELIVICSVPGHRELGMTARVVIR